MRLALRRRCRVCRLGIGFIVAGQLPVGSNIQCGSQLAEDMQTRLVLVGFVPRDLSGRYAAARG